MQKTCNYCHVIYSPRPQVKNPRACKDTMCQKGRQADNEREWRGKNQGIYDKKYHEVKRTLRLKEVASTVSTLIESLTIGLRFRGLLLNSNHHFLIQTFTNLGVHQLNKLYSPSSA